jgi:hypothetical protein
VPGSGDCVFSRETGAKGRCAAFVLRLVTLPDIRSSRQGLTRIEGDVLPKGLELLEGETQPNFGMAKP